MMSNDLISRRALMNRLRGNVIVDVTPALENAILKQPTAYDVDKVVEQLDEQSFIERDITDDDVVELDKAIEIVKAGGVNEKQN